MSDNRQIAVAVLLGTIVGALTMPPSPPSTAPASPLAAASAAPLRPSATLIPGPQRAAEHRHGAPALR